MQNLIDSIRRGLTSALRRCRAGLNPDESILADSFVEFITVVVLSNLPFLLLIVFYYFNDPNPEFTLPAAFRVIAQLWKPGEILVYVSALLAPFAFVIYKYHRAG